MCVVECLKIRLNALPPTGLSEHVIENLKAALILPSAADGER